MSADPATLRSPVRRPLARPAAVATRAVAYACVAFTLCAVLLMHLATIDAIVGVWLVSETFAHGFVIPAIVGWMIWRRRRHLSGLPVKPAPAALLALAALGALWLVSAVANVHVLQQYCLALMLGVSVLALLGTRYTRAIAFPLGYLLLAVPFGEIFIPPLIEFTARCTVFLLELSGIPVFRENNYLSLPSGNWSVVEACSGLRYLIASLSLGAMYAYTTYRSLRRRLLFIAVSAVVPVLANALRAFLIVLIGHWSGMTLAIGIDHLIYGWVFFGAVSAILFWVGARWREVDDGDDSAAATLAARQRAMPGVAASLAAPTTGGFVRMAVAVVALAAIWPMLAHVALRPAAPDQRPAPALTLSPPPAPWRAGPMSATDWHVLHMGRPQRWSANYSDGGRTVSLQLTWYRHQGRHSELLAAVRRQVVDGMPRWNEISTTRRDITVAGRKLTVLQSVEQAAGVKLLVWRWYRHDGADTASPQWMKLMLAKSKLLGGDDSGAEIALASAYDEDAGVAERAMHDLLLAMLPAIDQGLHHVAAR
ncbi:exosortase A [Duganella sp. CF517]|uniref:exosortase A n=1 Tax=Duganella sp. CF517 TaxID=1881038 RepID=UPI0008CC0318|nr:exosortase A [Duganella sp. CF517]SEN80731.1 exosortase A [Duganella sp. CF517]